MAIVLGVFFYEIIGIFAAVAILFVVYCKWAFGYWKKRGVPFVKPRIPWGSLQSHHRPSISMGEEFAQIYHNARKKGLRHVGLYTMTSPLYMPVDVDLVKLVLTKNFNYFIDRGIYVNEKDEPISAHLFAIGGKKWKTLRGKLTPTFTSGKMKIMYQTVVECGKSLEKFLDTRVNMQDPVDIKTILSNFTIDVIGSCAFGLECEIYAEENPFRDMAKRILDRTTMDDIKFAIAINFPKFAQYMRMTWIPDTIKDFFTEVVVDAVQFREDNNINRNDFLQSLIDIKNKDIGDGSKITIDEIVAQSFVFFVAGYETSATTMGWTLFELASNPDCQERVREEFNSVLKKYNGEMTYDALNELKYMEQCIDETLRKYPPIPFITRECVENYKVPESEVVIEKGVRVLIPVMGFHYDKEYFDEPDKYNPDRFSEENKRYIKQYTYLPFGEGPRLCIGMRFGIMQTKIGILTVLKNYKLSVSNKTQTPIKFTTAFVPTPEGGLWLDLKKIN